MEIRKDRKAGMRRLISKKVYKVERLWCYNRFYNANITGLLYLETRKFLWWELSPILYIEVKVPYIEKPFYDGEYGTNVRLSSLEVEMRAEMEVIKDKFQRRLDRLIKQTIGITLQDSCALLQPCRCSSPGAYHATPW